MEFSERISELNFTKHDFVKKDSRKQSPRSTTQQIEGFFKKNLYT